MTEMIILLATSSIICHGIIISKNYGHIKTCTFGENGSPKMLRHKEHRSEVNKYIYMTAVMVLIMKLIIFHIGSLQLLVLLGK